MAPSWQGQQQQGHPSPQLGYPPMQQTMQPSMPPHLMPQQQQLMSPLGQGQQQQGQASPQLGYQPMQPSMPPSMNHAELQRYQSWLAANAAAASNRSPYC